MIVRGYTQLLPKPFRIRTPQKSRGRVFVALSGGVDSSVTAALLKQAGYDVTGVFMKVWEPDIARLRVARGQASAEGVCTWREDRMDAMRVAAHLDIPFFTMDCEREYKEAVVDYMVAEYEAGRTPNPDVMCNKHVKFGVFFNKARELGADFVATGHYAQNAYDGSAGIYRMRRGVDAGKDQTYFLWTLTQRELAHTLFPVGAYPKAEVRNIAHEFGLPTADKKDSQGLCFIGKLDMKEFLSEFITPETGNVLDSDGTIIGTHDGVPFYTIGQRHGFTITRAHSQEVPLYVVAKDPARNTLTVAPKEELQELRHITDVVLSDTNWIRGYIPRAGDTYTAQERYHGTTYTATIKDVSAERARIHLSEAITASEGQSLVLYDRDECIGGGIISAST